GMQPEQFVQQVQQAGQLGAIYQDVRRSKALMTVVRAATVTLDSGEEVDLSDLLGSDEEEQEAPGTVEGEVVAEDAAEPTESGSTGSTESGSTGSTESTDDGADSDDNAGSGTSDKADANA
ncbi:MAG: hypothetical protein M3235_17770, partial [Actinomycetota bacterium]|nr:hypothetical protein [Actinomycetota bacterium]